MIFWIFAALLIPAPSFGLAIPGYLRPTHPAPTGHFHHERLLGHTREYKEFEWLWLQSPSGQKGWALKSSVLLPLDFSRKAQLTGTSHIYKSPNGKNLSPLKIESPQTVDVLARENRFFKIAYKKGKKTVIGWVQDSHLKPLPKDAGVFVPTKSVSLLAKPNAQSRRLAKANSKDRLIPLKIEGPWARVRHGKRKGFVPLSSVKTRLDIAKKVRTPKGFKKPHRDLFRNKIVEIFGNPFWIGVGNYTLDLKSKPDMSSPTVEVIKPWTSLRLRGNAVQRWGHSFLPRDGDIWWPAEFTHSSVAMNRAKSSIAYKLPPKSILQELQSPLVKGLRFASTPYGVYRSHKGQKHWRPVGAFNKGQPLSVSANGTLFVGDKVSFDHGTTFRSYIRWDKIFEALPRGSRKGHQPIRVVKVKPEKNNPKKIFVDLKIGKKSLYTIFTPDFGRTWSLLQTTKI